MAVGKAAGLRFVYVGNVQGHLGRHTLCPGCGRTVIRRDDARIWKGLLKNGQCAACGENLGVVHAWD